MMLFLDSVYHYFKKRNLWVYINEEHFILLGRISLSNSQNLYLSRPIQIQRITKLSKLKENNMKPVWYVQQRENDYDVNTQHIIYIIQEMGMEVHSDPYVPFGGMNYDFLPTDRPVIFHGAINAIRDGLRQGDKFYPCAWCDWKILTCQSYYTHWGKYLLQKHYGFYPLAVINRHQDHLFDVFGKDDKLFIRPDANNKEFTGETVCREKFSYWWQAATWDQPPLDIM